jgi:hypothetical protein
VYVVRSSKSAGSRGNAAPSDERITTNAPARLLEPCIVVVLSESVSSECDRGKEEVIERRRAVE